jgi:hypothetical protein
VVDWMLYESAIAEGRFQFLDRLFKGLTLSRPPKSSSVWKMSMPACPGPSGGRMRQDIAE